MIAITKIFDMWLMPGLLIRWLRNSYGIASIEAAFIFPILLTLLLGVWDAGTSLMINQKVLNASQVTADFLARKEKASPSDRDEAIKAAELAMQPYSTDIDYFIATIQFTDLGGSCPSGKDCPEIMDKTRDIEQKRISQSDVQDEIDATKGLGANGEGLIMVVIQYEYDPLFTDVFTGPVTFQEVAYARGRETSYVEFTS